MSISTRGWSVSKAGQCQTNPWLMVPVWSLMLECWCQTEAADYRKKCRCWTNLFLAFQHLHMIFKPYSKNNTIRSRLWKCRVYIFYYLQFGRALCIPFTTTNTRSMDLQGVTPFHRQQYGCVVCIPFHCQQYGHVVCILLGPPSHAQAFPNLRPGLLNCRTCQPEE